MKGWVIGALVGLLILCAGNWRTNAHNADHYKAQRDRQSVELHRVNTKCVVYTDGWAKCPPGVIRIIDTTTTTAAS